MDTIFISELKIDTIIGIYDWERKIRQTVTLDLELAVDINRAAYSGKVEFTLDYHAISTRLITFVEQSEFQLLESLAEQIWELLRREFHVPWMRLRLGKPGAVPQADCVGLIIERGKRAS